MGQRTLFNSPSIMYNLRHVVLEAFSVRALMHDYAMTRGKELSMLQTVPPLFGYSVIPMSFVECKEIFLELNF